MNTSDSSGHLTKQYGGASQGGTSGPPAAGNDNEYSFDCQNLVLKEYARDPLDQWNNVMKPSAANGRNVRSGKGIYVAPYRTRHRVNPRGDTLDERSTAATCRSMEDTEIFLFNQSLDETINSAEVCYSTCHCSKLLLSLRFVVQQYMII